MGVGKVHRRCTGGRRPPLLAPDRKGSAAAAPPLSFSLLYEPIVLSRWVHWGLPTFTGPTSDSKPRG